MNILILNVHSGLNLGDDAIMYETLRMIRRVKPDASIVVAANDPQSWQHHGGIEVLPSLTAWVIDRRAGWRWQKRAVLRYAWMLLTAVLLFRIGGRRLLVGSPEQQRLLSAYYTADLVLSCGGGNFYGQRRIDIALIWSIITLGFASALRKPVVMLPQSIGPVEGFVQKLLLRSMLRSSKRILLREERSQACVRALGAHERAVVLPDLAFGLPSAVGDQMLERQLEFPNRLRIGVTVMDRAAQDPQFTQQQHYEATLVTLLTRLNAQQGALIYIFVQCYGPTPDQDDRLPARRVFERVRQHTADVVLLETFSDALQIKGAYEQMDCMIGTRMHTGILALTANVPVTLIAYQPKTFGMMQLFGLEEFCCDINEIGDTVLFARVQKMIASRHDLQRQIKAQMLIVRDQLSGWEKYLQD